MCLQKPVQDIDEIATQGNLEEATLQAVHRCWFPRKLRLSVKNFVASSARSSPSYLIYTCIKVREEGTKIPLIWKYPLSTKLNHDRKKLWPRSATAFSSSDEPEFSAFDALNASHSIGTVVFYTLLSLKKGRGTLA